MPTGREDFWYGQVLLFEQAPTDGRVDAGPTSDWAYDHENDPNAHHTPPSAFSGDHADLTNVLTSQHHVKYADAEAVAAMGAKGDSNPLHHDRYADAEAVTAMGAKGDANALNHDKYTDAEAVAAVTGYVDRGDPSAVDFDTASWTKDAAWNDLDLSSIVPANALAVLVELEVRNDAANAYMMLRKKGNSNDAAKVQVRTQAAAVYNTVIEVISIDSNREVEYKMQAAGWTWVTLTVNGWWF